MTTIYAIHENYERHNDEDTSSWLDNKIVSYHSMEADALSHIELLIKEKHGNQFKEREKYIKRKLSRTVEELDKSMYLTIENRIEVDQFGKRKKFILFYIKPIEVKVPDLIIK